MAVSVEHLPGADSQPATQSNNVLNTDSNMTDQITPPPPTSVPQLPTQIPNKRLDILGGTTQTVSLSNDDATTNDIDLGAGATLEALSAAANMDDISDIVSSSVTATVSSTDPLISALTNTRAVNTTSAAVNSAAAALALTQVTSSAASTSISDDEEPMPSNHITALNQGSGSGRIVLIDDEPSPPPPDMAAQKPSLSLQNLNRGSNTISHSNALNLNYARTPPPPTHNTASKSHSSGSHGGSSSSAGVIVDIVDVMPTTDSNSGGIAGSTAAATKNMSDKPSLDGDASNSLKALVQLRKKAEKKSSESTDKGSRTMEQWLEHENSIVHPVWIGNLPRNTTVRNLRRFVESKIGRVLVSIHICVKQNATNERTYAFLNLPTAEKQILAVTLLDAQIFQNEKLIVRPKRPSKFPQSFFGSSPISEHFKHFRDCVVPAILAEPTANLNVQSVRKILEHNNINLDHLPNRVWCVQCSLAPQCHRTYCSFFHNHQEKELGRIISILAASNEDEHGLGLDGTRGEGGQDMSIRSRHTLLIQGLPRNITSLKLTEMFDVFGDIDNVIVNPNNTCYLRMKRSQDARKIVHLLKDNNSGILIDFAPYAAIDASRKAAEAAAAAAAAENSGSTTSTLLSNGVITSRIIASGPTMAGLRSKSMDYVVGPPDEPQQATFESQMPVPLPAPHLPQFKAGTPDFVPTLGAGTRLSNHRPDMMQQSANSTPQRHHGHKMRRNGVQTRGLTQPSTPQRTSSQPRLSGLGPAPGVATVQMNGGMHNTSQQPSLINQHLCTAEQLQHLLEQQQAELAMLQGNLHSVGSASDAARSYYVAPRDQSPASQPGTMGPASHSQPQVSQPGLAGPQQTSYFPASAAHPPSQSLPPVQGSSNAAIQLGIHPQTWASLDERTKAVWLTHIAQNAQQQQFQPMGGNTMAGNAGQPPAQMVASSKGAGHPQRIVSAQQQQQRKSSSPQPGLFSHYDQPAFRTPPPQATGAGAAGGATADAHQRGGHPMRQTFTDDYLASSQHTVGYHSKAPRHRPSLIKANTISFPPQQQQQHSHSHAHHHTQHHSHNPHHHTQHHHNTSSYHHVSPHMQHQPPPQPHAHPYHSTSPQQPQPHIDAHSQMQMGTRAVGIHRAQTTGHHPHVSGAVPRTPPPPGTARSTTSQPSDDSDMVIDEQTKSYLLHRGRMALSMGSAIPQHYTAAVNQAVLNLTTRVPNASDILVSDDDDIDNFLSNMDNNDDALGDINFDF